MLSIQADIDFCLKEYSKQKKLEEIIGRRQLVRPNTKKWQVILLYVIVPVLLTCIVCFSFWLPAAPIINILVFFVLLLAVFELYIRYCLIQTIKCYQHYAKEETRRRCLCIPSCSEYAILCLKKFLLVIALIKIRTRLYKSCKGEDYKVDYP